jgi:hypothetical protein
MELNLIKQEQFLLLVDFQYIQFEPKLIYDALQIIVARIKWSIEKVK